MQEQLHGALVRFGAFCSTAVSKMPLTKYKTQLGTLSQSAWNMSCEPTPATEPQSLGPRMGAPKTLPAAPLDAFFPPEEPCPQRASARMRCSFGHLVASQATTRRGTLMTSRTHVKKRHFSATVCHVLFRLSGELANLDRATHQQPMLFAESVHTVQSTCVTSHSSPTRENNSGPAGARAQKHQR